MKKCPQCNSLFDDETRYCLNDGAALVEEILPLPSELSSDEEPTVVRSEPIVVDLSAGETPAAESLPPTQPISPVVVKKTSDSGTYIIVLVLGLILGGVLVLTALLLTQNFFRSGNSNKPEISAVNSNQTAKNTNLLINQKISENLHHLKTGAGDEEFNGRVIALNAFVRSSPAKTSNSIDTLPVDDRINIQMRKHSNSPWYYIVCEHGTSGWMHGNTIEFTQ